MVHEPRLTWYVTVTVSLIMLGAAWSATLADLDDGLVGYWNFDEGDGNVAYDSSPNGNNGTLYGDPAWIMGRPECGHALQFDGDGDFVDMGGVPSGDLDVTGDLTIVALFKTGQTQLGALVNKLDNSSNDSGDPDDPLKDNGYYLGMGQAGWLPAETLSFKLASSSQNLENLDIRTTTPTFTDNEWHCAAAIYTPDGSSRPTIFVDGDEQPGSDYGEPKSSIGASGPIFAFRIGAYSPGPPTDPTQEFKGAIDEVRVYDRALTQEEIDLVCSPPPCVPASSGGALVYLGIALFAALTLVTLGRVLRA